MYIHLSSFVIPLYNWHFIFDVDAVLDKKTEILDIMTKHGIMDGLCEIFSTTQDEDILVCIDKSIFLCLD